MPQETEEATLWKVQEREKKCMITPNNQKHRCRPQFFSLPRLVVKGPLDKSLSWWKNLVRRERKEVNENQTYHANVTVKKRPTSSTQREGQKAKNALIGQEVTQDTQETSDL